MTRRSLSASEAIDEVDSPVDGLEDGSLSIIPSQTTGNVTDVWRRTTSITRRSLPQDGSVLVRFEIPYAHIMPPPNESSPTIKKYVMYDLSVRQDSTKSTDPTPVTIERRYTDFSNLYEGLRAEHPTLLNQIPFPKKVFLGNFSATLIAERSAAFEALLDHIMSLSDLRESSCFLQFLRDTELTKACRLLDERRNEMAIPILEDCFRLLNKIFMDRSKSVLLLLCRLVAACTTSPVPHPSAEKWAELALRRYDGVSDADLLTLYIPLIHTCVHLWWQRGRDNQFLQDRLKALENKGIPVKNGKTLTQAIHALDPRTETV
ncbi:sorting nexin-21 isoform X2 [Contarinia nasturtii]|nr:sorting nexin-21 isoform X2 [Contarinia nasturtii]